jgi:hypothetical protein
MWAYPFIDVMAVAIAMPPTTSENLTSGQSKLVKKSLRSAIPANQESFVNCKKTKLDDQLTEISDNKVFV